MLFAVPRGRRQQQLWRCAVLATFRHLCWYVSAISIIVSAINSLIVSAQNVNVVPRSGSAGAASPENTHNWGTAGAASPENSTRQDHQQAPVLVAGSGDASSDASSYRMVSDMLQQVSTVSDMLEQVRWRVSPTA